MASEVNKQEIFMKFILFISLLLGNSLLANAQQFEPPVIIDPPHPMVGDTIRIGIYTEYYPPCILLPRQNHLGQTHLFETNGNHFDLTVVADALPICNPLPFFAPREYYELGQLPEGDYSIQVYAVGVLTPLPVPPPNPFPYPVITFGSTVNFSVTKPIIISTNSNLGLIILLFLFLTLFFFIKRGLLLWR